MDALIIFTKYPEPGKVGKEIDKLIGLNAVADLYKAMINDIVKEHQIRDYDLYLSFLDNGYKEKYRDEFPSTILYVHRSNNLTENMRNAFEDLLQDYEKVIIIGVDVPHLSHDTIKNAFFALDSYDIVLGPIGCGGYYLIGMKKCLDIFGDLPWDHSTLLSEQIKRIKAKNMSCAVLNEMIAVDSVKCLQRLKQELKREQAPNTYDFLKSLDV